MAREAPGTGQAGIAVLRGSDRVQLVGERDGWSEILLSDGRRAWVPTTGIAPIGDARSPRSIEVPPVAVATPSPEAASNSSDATARELTTEVARLRGVLDELTTWQALLPEPNAARPSAEDIPWVIGGVALVIGLLIGGAWERHRSRRDRSLRF